MHNYSLKLVIRGILTEAGNMYKYLFFLDDILVINYQKSYLSLNYKSNSPTLKNYP